MLLCCCAVVISRLHCRIFGLEARSALLVLTPKNIHILDGFQINMCASGEKVIEWSEIVSKSVGSTGLSSSKRKEKRITSLNRKQNLALENEKSWLDKIWYQLLHVDFGYFQIPLHEVRIIMRVVALSKIFILVLTPLYCLPLTGVCHL